jgi:hypothetical protein
MRLVEAGEVGRAVRYGGAEKEAEAPAVALAAQCSDRRVDLWRSHASDGVSVGVKLVHHRRNVGGRQEGGPRRQRTVYDPPIEPIHGGVECLTDWVPQFIGTVGYHPRSSRGVSTALNGEKVPRSRATFQLTVATLNELDAWPDN